MPLKIIVNGDDLGIGEAVNDATFGGMTNGLITSTTVLSNGPAMEASQRMLGFFPQCSIGVTFESV